MRRSVRFSFPGSFFLLQKILNFTLSPPHPADSGVLDPVAAIVAGLSPLGSLPELAAQALRSVIQPAADKFFGRCLDFFL